MTSHRHHGTALDVAAMPIEHFRHHPDSFIGGHIREADEPVVFLPIEEDQLSEVVVDGDQDPVFSGGCLEESAVAGIWPQRCYLDDIMPQGSKEDRQTPARAAVDQELHFLSTWT